MRTVLLHRHLNTDVKATPLNHPSASTCVPTHGAKRYKPFDNKPHLGNFFIVFLLFFTRFLALLAITSLMARLKRSTGRGQEDTAWLDGLQYFVSRK